MAHGITTAVEEITDNRNTYVTPDDIHAACQAAGRTWRERERVLRSQSVAGVERELLAFALVYSTICAVRTVIAVQLETTPVRVSLLHVVRLLCHGLDRASDAAIVVNPDRPGRVQPRVVKRRPLQYSLMTRPRAELKHELMRNPHGVT